MAVQPPLVSFSNLYSNDNLSRNSLGLTHDQDMDQELKWVCDQFEGKHVVVTAVPGLRKIKDKILRIFTPKDEQLLSSENIMASGMGFSSRLNKILGDIRDKQGRQKSLNETERAVNHFWIHRKGLAHLERIENGFRDAWTLKKRQFNSENIGKYPLTNLNGNILRISIKDLAKVSNDGRYSSNPVRPFIYLNTSPERRAALYSNLLEVRPFTESDVKSHLQRRLVGENKVVAKEKIPAGKCIGLYTGIFLPQKSFLDGTQSNLLNTEYTLQILNEEGQPCGVIDGEGILSRMNTVFEIDKEGTIRQAQDPEKYNVAITSFLATIENDSGEKARIYLPAFFTRRDIAIGEELVWRYGYNPEKIKKIFENFNFN